MSAPTRRGPGSATTPAPRTTTTNVISLHGTALPLVRRSTLPADPIGAAMAVVESIGTVGAHQWVRRFADEAGIAPPADLVVKVAALPSLADQLDALPEGHLRRAEIRREIELTVVSVVRHLMGVAP